MTTQEFLTLLQAHSNKKLIFEYDINKFVRADYHLTEVKNITIDAVDCGAGTDFWQETIVQLWESETIDKNATNMSAFKALAILKKVDGIRPMVKTAEIKFEYGNSTFHTAQLFIKNTHSTAQNLTISLAATKTDCKAKDACGIPEPTPTNESCCSPSSGCC